MILLKEIVEIFSEFFQVEKYATLKKHFTVLQ